MALLSKGVNNKNPKLAQSGEWEVCLHSSPPLHRHPKGFLYHHGISEVEMIHPSPGFVALLVLQGVYRLEPD